MEEQGQQGQSISGLLGTLGGAAAMATPAGAAMAGAKIAGKAIGGLVNMASGLIGGRKRRQEQRAARADLARQKEKYEQLDTSNPYQNVTNPYANLTVNTQAADFASQQSAQGAANIMSGLAAAAGGGGVAALAQSLANSQAQQAQQASASIAQQESQNQQLAAAGEQKRQQLVGMGQLASQKLSMTKQTNLINMAQDRLEKADAARAQAKQQFMGGLGQTMGAGLTAAAGGVFDPKEGSNAGDEAQ